MALDPQTAEEIPLEAAAEVTRRRRGGLFFLGLAASVLAALLLPRHVRRDEGQDPGA